MLLTAYLSLFKQSEAAVPVAPSEEPTKVFPLLSLPGSLLDTIGEYMTPAENFKLAMDLLPRGDVSYPYPANAAVHYAKVVAAFNEVKGDSSLDKVIREVWSLHTDTLGMPNQSQLADLSLQQILQGRLNLRQASILIRILLDCLGCLTVTTGKGLQAFLAANPQPITLRLWGSALRDADLASLSGMSGLQHLDIWKCPFTDAGMIHLASLTNLRDLRIEDTKVTGAGLAFLAHLPNMSSLSVHGPLDSTEVGVTHIANLRGLKRLSLFNERRMAAAGFRHLSQLAEIVFMSLIGIGITDSELESIASFKGLEILYLGINKFTDAGLAHLGNLQGLRELDLTGNQLTDAGVVHLTTLNKLERLILHRTGITPAGQAQLKALIPGLKIED